MSDFHEKDLIAATSRATSRSHEQKELLRFVAVGSVDDGKSTLIGRLLYDTGMVFEDQLAALAKGKRLARGRQHRPLAAHRRAHRRARAGHHHRRGLPLLLHREAQVHHRRHAGARAVHAQHGDRRVHGDVAIILIDARLGVLEQSRRHAFIASLLGIPHLVVVRQQDGPRRLLRRGVRQISADFCLRGQHEAGVQDHHVLPGEREERRQLRHQEPEPRRGTRGQSVLHLETVPVAQDRDLEHFRFPVQYVIRPNLDYRGFAGGLVVLLVDLDDAQRAECLSRAALALDMRATSGDVAQHILEIVTAEQVDTGAGI
jgi:sulfate adenylyltransferase subunit 1